MKFLNTLQSEWLKTKNSTAMMLTIVGAFFVPTIITVSRIVQHDQTVLVNSSLDAWQNLYKQNWQFMAVLLLPIGIILVSSLLAQIEYRSNTWKQLFTTPQTISTIFWAKYAIIFFIIIQFFILFTIGIYLSTVIPSFIYSDVPYPKEAFPFKDFFLSNAHYFIYALPIVALQYLMSLHIKNFIVPVGVGLALTIAALIAVNNKYGYILPYIYGGMKFLITDNRIDDSIPVTFWALGYFFYFTLANYLIFICKTQTRVSKYFKVKPLIILLSGVLILGVLSMVYLHQLNNKKIVRDHTRVEIQKNIQLFEKNLGAFHIKNTDGWSLKERMKFYKVKGLSIAVVNNFKIEWAKGYGWANEEAKIPITTKTIFEPGSLSKSINAFALMQLAQNKKLDLFADINQYLRSWKFPYNQLSKGKKITTVNLLTHTAGLGVHGFEGYQEGDSLPTIKQILDGKKPANSVAVRSIYEPNKKMEYSGGGSMISQLMLMDITKMPYDKYLNDHIFKPLQMSSSSYTQPLPISKRAFAAIGYDTIGKPLSYKYPIMVEQAAAGLWTTPIDICKFIIEVQNSLRNKSNKILNQRYMSLMVTPYIDERAALGFFIDDNKGFKYFGHSAGNWGFSGAFFGSIEDGDGIAVFINSENDKILNEVINSVVEVYRWNGFEKKEQKKIIKLFNSDLDKFVGLYETKGDNLKVKIIKENNELYYLVNKEKRKVYFTSKTEFINMENPALRIFTIDKNNVVKGFKVKYKDKEANFSKI